jgi:DNA-binding NtrC family response regulator
MLYDWPGNVRELENSVARALALNPSGTILVDDLPAALRSPQRKPAAGAPQAPLQGAAPGADPLLADRPPLDEMSRRYAGLVLREQGGNKTRAAEALGIDRKTLSRLLGPDE